MKKSRIRIALSLALLLLVAISVQAFAAVEGNSYHIHCWRFHENIILPRSVGANGHIYVTTTYYKCDGCGEKEAVKTETSDISPHTFRAGVYTGENNHVLGVEQHRAKFRKTCSICRYTTEEWVYYYCSGQGQHIVPNIFQPVQVEK